MPEGSTDWGPLWALAALLPATVLASLSTAVIERAGPIRLRHWVEESGGRLRTLFETPARFAVFRYLLNLLAKLLPVPLFLALAELGGQAGLATSAGPALAVVVAVVAVTEIVSRAGLSRDPESALSRLTGVYRVFLVLLWPRVVVFAPLISRRVRRGAGEPASAADEASEEEIEAFIDVGTREGILEPEERDLVRGIVDFGDTQVKSVMTPRIDMVCAPFESELEELAQLFVESGYSRLPLYRDSIDHVVGVLHIRDLLAALRSQPAPELASLLQEPLFVPESKRLDLLLKELQARRQQMAIVVDEYGGTAGLVTVEDLLEEIVGEIGDEHDESEPENQSLPDGSLLLDGRAHVETLDEHFDLALDEAPFETVGGLVSSQLGYVPKAGEVLEFRGLRFEIEKADERRVLSLRVRRSVPEETAGV